CRGGKVNANYLKQFTEYCVEIIGDLVIQGLTKRPNGVEKLKKVTKINGRLVVKSNTAIKDLSFLSGLQEIKNPSSAQPSLEVADNANFALKGLTAIKKIQATFMSRLREHQTYKRMHELDKTQTITENLLTTTESEITYPKPDFKQNPDVAKSGGKAGSGFNATPWIALGIALLIILIAAIVVGIIYYKRNIANAA
ncbi:hypothetical protein COOONC_12094, partial [Cooperia oncophora]